MNQIGLIEYGIYGDVLVLFARVGSLIVIRATLKRTENRMNKHVRERILIGVVEAGSQSVCKCRIWCQNCCFNGI